jgi:hypothetical protein
MLSRALISATVALLIGCFAAYPVRAQNLEAGKSPSQIFANTCTACHKSPRGLLKTVPAGSLPGFLRQHYTTSPDMASLLSSYLISNGAIDTRYSGGQPKEDAKQNARSSEGKPAEQVDRWGRRIRAAAPSQEPVKPEAGPEQAGKPDADGLAEPGRKGRNAKRLARPAEEAAKPAEGEAKEGAKEDATAHAVNERGPDGRKSKTRQRLGKKGKPGAEELPKDEAAKTDAAKDAPNKDAAKPDAGKEEPARGEAAKEEKPGGETAKDEGAKLEGTPKESGSNQAPALRPDPVPPVTPAPAAPPAASTAVSGGTPEPAASPPSPPPATASAAPPSSAAPAVPPISK